MWVKAASQDIGGCDNAPEGAAAIPHSIAFPHGLQHHTGWLVYLHRGPVTRMLCSAAFMGNTVLIGVDPVKHGLDRYTNMRMSNRGLDGTYTALVNFVGFTSDG